MNIRDLTVKDYIDALSSDAPAPGGGSAGAMCGVQGAALTLMVINLTLGHERYTDYFNICRDAQQKMTAIRESFLDAADKDAEVFSAFSEAYKMPKATDEQKAARKEALAATAVDATKAPVEVMRMALDALGIIKKLVGNSNPKVASDLGVAAVNFLGCVQSEWLNVLINLSSITDVPVRNGLKNESEQLLQKAETLASRIFIKIEDSFK